MHARFFSPHTGRFLSVDPSKRSWDRRQPQSWNRYSYVRGNPLKYRDPDGKVLDTVLDVGFVAYDLFDIGRSLVKGEGVSGQQLLALGADVAGVFVPFATGGGLAVRLGDNVASSAAGVAKLRAAVKKGFLGENARNVRTSGSGRLKGFTRADTDLPGGKKAATDLFESLAGKKPEGNLERVVLEDQNLEVVFRVDDDKVKVEVINHGLETHEKITFLPE